VNGIEIQHKFTSGSLLGAREVEETRMVSIWSPACFLRQAAWAARKYRGHRVLPPDIFEELEKKGVV
jgi:hypothetical protein